MFCRFAQVAHVWGTAYDMGYAQGELLRDEMREFIPDVYSYLVEQVRHVKPGAGLE